ncbi:MAG TPA: hypothetical protein VMF30_01150 [Pirellulales bacterium]|nr:hypothetical protein [Pirellulales bacterium]
MPLNAVIQGPLHSPPTPRAKRPESLTPDCVPSVLTTARAIAEGNGTAVVSTWKGEDAAKLAHLAAEPALAGIVETPDPGRPPDTSGPVFDNRLRQALSTLQGILELERRGVTGVVAKIRTDQTAPVELIDRFTSDYLAGASAEARERLVFIHGAHVDGLYEIDDFVFVGTLTAMRRFFEAQVQLAPFHSGTVSIHGDLVRKHMYATVAPAIGLEDWRCFPVPLNNLGGGTARPRIHADAIGPWVRVLTDFLVPLPQAVWTGMTWRGSPPFTPDWMPVAHRICFEDREAILKDGEDFFLRRWPNIFDTRGSGRLRRPLDYCLEIPREIRGGGTNRLLGSYRRMRRLVNRMRIRRAK